MSKIDDVLDGKDSFNFLKGSKRVRVKIAMKEYSKRQLNELKAKMEKEATRTPGSNQKWVPLSDILKEITDIQHE